nr:hypothetical protein [Tanacetum cinerariifolium]
VESPRSHTLKQQTLTVEEFIAEFECVRMRCGVEGNEEQTIARFLGSLRTDISDVVCLQQYYSFHESATGPVRVGPIKADPPALTGISSTPTTPSLRCFKCKGIGHLKRDCPNKLVLTLIDEADPLYDTEDEVETEVVYPGQGELLVTRRLLNIVVLDQDDDTTWLRTNIFRTQCTAKGKICTVSPPSVVFGLLMIKENPVTATAPLSMVPLLNEFKDVLPEEIPAGLPVIREIQHWIDFLPEASIPNKPAYRMNPKEFTELHRQVTELLEKGLIRESMSPCAVPALLVPKPGGTFRMCTDSRAERAFVLIQQKSQPLQPGRRLHHYMTCAAFTVWRRFTAGSFSTIVAPITECLKSSKFVWNTAAQSAFEQLKHAVTEALVLALPNFEHFFQVECDSSGLEIGGVLSQLNRPIAFFSEKLNDTRWRYSTYDKEFYAIVRSLVYWRHYLLSAEFILYSDHQALKFIQGQAKLKPQHAKWVETLQDFSFVSGFAPFAHLYQDDPDFKELWDKCHGGIFRDFVSLGSLVVDKPKQWDVALPQAEFAYNRSNHSSTGRSPFFIVYGRNPFTPLDLAPMVGDGSVSAEGDECSRQIKELHAQGRFGKLHLRTDGPFRILKKINDNAYKVELPGHCGVYDTFNVADLSPYTPNADFDYDSGSSRFLEGEDDTDQRGSPLSPTQVGPLESG